MQKFSDWRVGSRLAAAFAVLMLFTTTVGMIGMYSMSAIHARLDHAVQHLYPLTVEASDLRTRLTMQMSNYQSLLVSNDSVTVTSVNQAIEENKKKIGELLEKLDKNVSDARARSELARYLQVRSEFSDSGKRMRELSAAGNSVKALAEYRVTMQPLLPKIHDALEGIENREHELMMEGYAQAESSYDSAIMIMVILMVSVVLLGVIIGVFMTRGVTRPLGQALALAKQVAAGNLTGKLTQIGNDEVGQLLGALDAMNTSLRQTVARVRRGAETISSATAEIAVGNEDLSSRTEEQACSLQETAASMEEMTSTVKNNAENSSQANAMFASAQELAQQSVDRIGEVSETMRMISSSSQRMGEIVSVIDSIAFQTNILALNASVEAARAGEQGRGFAVVASEVRNLAQRSAASAKEIKALIDDSMEKVKHGDTLVVQAENIVRKMGENTQPVINLVREIAQASQEQSDGIAQINVAIAQIDSTTQQNAALVEQAAAAAASLREQAAVLVQTVQHFDTGDDTLGDEVVSSAPHDVAHAGV